jgi:hypothetical protein
MSTLSSQMQTACRVHSIQASKLLKHYRIVPYKYDIDDLECRLQQSFYEGVHEAYQCHILNTLTKDHPKQQDLANSLGLKNRSSISQMKRSKRIDAVRLTAALYNNPNITLPSQERAALFGFARATSHVKGIALGDPNIEGSMGPQDFSYLTGLLACDQWDSAVRDPNLSKARILAEQIVTERTVSGAGPIRKGDIEPEQLVFMLQGLWLSWADFGILSLSVIPELIPEVTRYEV